MERIIQPYAGPGAGLSPRSAVPTHQPVTAIPAKSASDLVRAVRRRAPLIVVMTVLAGMLGSAYVVRLPAVFRAVAHVQIDPPKFDPIQVIIMTGGAIPSSDREANEKFVPNRLVWLQGRRLASQILNQGELGIGRGYEADPEIEIISNLSIRSLKAGTNVFEVALEGADPERVTKLLKVLLETFSEKVKVESSKELDNAQVEGHRNLKQLQDELQGIESKIKAVSMASPIFGPNGKNILVDDYTALKSLLMTKKIRFDDLRHEERITSMYPALKAAAPPSKYQKRLDYLTERREYYAEQLENTSRLVKNLDNDPSAKYWARLLNRTLDDLEAIQKLDTPQDFPDRSAISLAHGEQEINKLDREVKAQFDRIQATMPEYQSYQSLLRGREQKEQRITAMDERLSHFKMVAETRSSPVEIIQTPSEPGGPVKPNRPMLIGMFTMLGLVLGLGLVCAREYLDHTVTVPEHLTAGLVLPILTVIPRIRRLSRLQRGGHLWTANDPHSLEADAYRNLRASIIGATGPKQRPIVTLLITSAKAGDGKSTTALNLALTCARAGERTLLMDVDLRRPSLAEVFDVTEPNVGLVDVLRGDMPWQQAVVRTDVPNLNFLPTGDPTGVPIEVLGTLELRQLIAAVSQQYQRVILDAPAVLGMADCRMLGRTVDAAVLVVRSGVHELRPLRRAKEMLEQSRVPIAGLVFNGLSEDLDNWSSYGTNALPVRSMMPRPGLDAPSDLEEAVATTAGSTEV
ncbi:MAG: capsular exopolysaccharide biosynthesis protein [Planctomycetota bacterium]|nr:capsular exopolysaccharide biosynthesis protein [Planctomycetota bacterium]